MSNNHQKRSIFPLPYDKNNGFTLAEMLITITIIGVIAAITIQPLMNNTNNNETVKRLKKAHSTLSQATNLIIAEEGPVIGWTNSADNIYNLYKKYLFKAKECDTNAGCMPQNNIKYLSGGTHSFTDNRYKKLILADGVLIIFANDDYYSPTCSANRYNTKICMQILVDVNGPKQPNTAGKDAFAFILKDDGLYPAGCENIEANCANKNGGWGCTCKVIKDDAINY